MKKERRANKAAIFVINCLLVVVDYNAKLALNESENMYSQVDTEGFQYNLLHEIIDHQRDESAVSKEDMYIVTNRGAKRLRQTTVGWKLLVVWRDGSDQWIPLKDLKESNPLDVADYAKANRIDDESHIALSSIMPCLLMQWTIISFHLFSCEKLEFLSPMFLRFTVSIPA